MRYRKQTQHIRRYRSGRWTYVNRGIRYQKPPKMSFSRDEIEKIKLIVADCRSFLDQGKYQKQALDIYKNIGEIAEDQIPNFKHKLWITESGKVAGSKVPLNSDELVFLSLSEKLKKLR